MKKNSLIWVLLIAFTAAVCTALAVYCLRIRDGVPAAEYPDTSSDDAAAVTEAESFHTKPEQTEPEETEPEQSENDRDFKDVLQDLFGQSAGSKKSYPVVKLKTKIYPDFTKAGLDEKVLDYYPLHPCHGQYAMLFDSESVILSEPVRLSEMPEGYDSVTLWFAYDPDRVGDRLSRMQIMRFDPDAADTAQESEFQKLEGAETDTKQHCIRITVDRPGVYYVYDTNSWVRLWGTETDTPFFYRNPTVGFETEIPAEIMFMQYMISFNQIEEEYLPDEVRWYDNSGARHIAPLMFTRSGTDPGIYDFRMEWVTDSAGADAAAEAFISESLNPEGRRRKVVRNDSGTLPDGTYRRLIMTTAPAHGNSPAQAELFAAYDLKQGEIITVHYALDPAAKERLYDTLTDSLDTFRKTGTALQ